MPLGPNFCTFSPDASWLVVPDADLTSSSFVLGSSYGPSPSGRWAGALVVVVVVVVGVVVVVVGGRVVVVVVLVVVVSGAGSEEQNKEGSGGSATNFCHLLKSVCCTKQGTNCLGCGFGGRGLGPGPLDPWLF